jgi:predicted nucleic acid-binding protein
LRAGDALHLAIASNLAVDQIITLDEGMITAGKVLKLPVDRGI